MKKIVILIISILFFTSCSKSCFDNSTMHETNIDVPTITYSTSKTEFEIDCQASDNILYIHPNNIESKLLLPVCDDGKVGFVNELGECIVRGIYDRGRFTSEKLNVVMLDDLYGAIDLKGDIVIPIEYEYLGDFNCGLAMAKKNDLYGFINRKGEVVVDFKYVFARNYSENIAIVSSNYYDYEFINTEGEIICLNSFKKNLFWGDFHCGLMINGHSYYNAHGELAIEPKFNVENFSGWYPCDFSEGVALYPLPKSDFDLDVQWVDGDNWYYTYIDIEGNEIFDIRFEKATSFSDGLAIVTLDGKTGCIDKTGEFVFYNDAVYGQYSEGFVKYCNKDSETQKYGFLDKDGNIVIDAIYDQIWREFINGFALVQIGENLAYIDYNGTIVFLFGIQDYIPWDC